MINLIRVWRSSGGDDTIGVDLGIEAGAVKILAVAAGNAGWSKFLPFFFSALSHQLFIHHQYPVQKSHHHIQSTDQRASGC